MSENKRLRVLKNIAGGLLLVSVLHYVLDKPTRPPLVRSAFTQLHRIPLLFKKPKQKTESPVPQPVWTPPVVVLNYQQLLGDPSFELWEVQPYPMFNTWFSSVTISASEVVKKETEIVQHGLSAVRLEHDGVGHCGNVRQELPPEAIPWLRGRRLKFSAWALSTIPGAPCVHIDDGVGRSSVCLQNPSLAWEPVTVERMISPEATRVLLIIDISREATGETAASVFVDNASFAENLPSLEAPGVTAVTAPLPSPSPEQR